MSVVAAFAGYREDVAEQVDAARALGFANVEEASGAREFWNGGTPAKASVLPSRTVAVLTEINAPEWLAHLGNGIIFHRGGTPVKGATAHGVMIDRIKAAYDPNGILPHIV
jgi:hypothetical protein